MPLVKTSVPENHLKFQRPIYTMKKLHGIQNKFLKAHWNKYQKPIHLCIGVSDLACQMLFKIYNWCISGLFCVPFCFFILMDISILPLTFWNFYTKSRCLLDALIAVNFNLFTETWYYSISCRCCYLDWGILCGHIYTHTHAHTFSHLSVSKDPVIPQGMSPFARIGFQWTMKSV